MNRHQVLTGAANAGDHCYSVGSVEGVPFTAYASGCNIVILASNFQRVQIIPGLMHGNVQVGCLDSSTDVGKIAAAYGTEVCIYEPTPLLHQSSSHVSF
ncbi:dmX-like protein 1 [Trichonephila inaurata madagascariensis]|uniref:DmX-like protein 1 n=1 Tax=Trichonephila inaurata madagascariensis TaxID=2747483 RepID=A0A8X6X7N0_9ARAC|nr:dmX-like protein 1 [Trichonephila inaurata madagascariensis]